MAVNIQHPSDSWRARAPGQLQGWRSAANPGMANSQATAGAGATGMTSETRAGIGHFGGTAGPVAGPSSEDRTGVGHFNPAATAPGAPAPSAPPTPDYGTQSGPGILENWFNQRANGTDPGYQYAMTRGMNDIDSRMSAGGSYNSGARGQQLSDFASNMGAQREGQLDALAGGASGEHQGRLNAMFGQGMGLAGGQAGTMGQYDLASANSNNALMNALVQMMGNKAGVDQKANQGMFNNVLGAASLFA